MQTDIYTNRLSTLSSVAHLSSRKSERTWGFLELFIVSQTLLPGLLYLPGTQALRVPIRTSAYAIGLCALVYFWTRRDKIQIEPHQSVKWLLAAAMWLAMQIFHPATNTLLSGVAEVMMYVAVFSPVIWAPSMIRTREQVWRLLLILMLCNGISSFFGIMQVYDPARWLPAEFSTVAIKDTGPLSFRGPNGENIIRPCGLTDAPGGVCTAGATAALLGLVLASDIKAKAWKRLMCVGFAFLGFAAIYLSHIRTSLLTTVGSLLVFSWVLWYHGKRFRAALFIGLLAFMFLASLYYAATLGGSSVINRFSSLLEDDPVSTYSKNRGAMMNAALQDFAAQYPLGAGLGRCGMMRTYFGDETNRDSPMIWAEIQVPLWLLDGGLFLVFLYGTALLLNFRFEILSALWPNPDAELRELAAIIFTLNLSIFSHCFSSCPFIGSGGVQYWLMAGILLALMKPASHIAPRAVATAPQQISPRPRGLMPDWFQGGSHHGALPPG